MKKVSSVLLLLALAVVMCSAASRKEQITDGGFVAQIKSVVIDVANKLQDEGVEGTISKLAANF